MAWGKGGRPDMAMRNQTRTIHGKKLAISDEEREARRERGRKVGALPRTPRRESKRIEGILAANERRRRGDV